MNMNSKPIVTVIRPNVTAEEREKRIERVKQCMVDFWLACPKRKDEKNAPFD